MVSPCVEGTGARWLSSGAKNGSPMKAPLPCRSGEAGTTSNVSPSTPPTVIGGTRAPSPPGAGGFREGVQQCSRGFSRREGQPQGAPPRVEGPPGSSSSRGVGLPGVQGLGPGAFRWGPPLCPKPSPKGGRSVSEPPFQGPLPGFSGSLAERGWAAGGDPKGSFLAGIALPPLRRPLLGPGSHSARPPRWTCTPRDFGLGPVFSPFSVARFLREWGKCGPKPCLAFPGVVGGWHFARGLCGLVGGGALPEVDLLVPPALPNYRPFLRGGPPSAGAPTPHGRLEQGDRLGRTCRTPPPLEPCSGGPTRVSGFSAEGADPLSPLDDLLAGRLRCLPFPLPKVLGKNDGRTTVSNGLVPGWSLGRRTPLVPGFGAPGFLDLPSPGGCDLLPVPRPVRSSPTNPGLPPGSGRHESADPGHAPRAMTSGGVAASLAFLRTHSPLGRAPGGPWGLGRDTSGGLGAEGNPTLLRSSNTLYGAPRDTCPLRLFPGFPPGPRGIWDPAAGFEDPL
ncbi:hypothetical protein GWK47_034586 [Chionoecetes opilio]|uniref:Uncharacterized protein n=1 Tax=Chionoecetes opilio TaxID=41210 RepID=A0A8J4YR63_CHIOP|nr:hypothetical protein GWK47_034586 [Chionoecetes opilio]